MNDQPGSKRTSLRHLRAFVAVCRHRSLTRAADSLFLTQSALSLTIRQLEEDVGLTLFDRSTRRLELTHAAEEFLPAALRLLSDFDSTLDDIRALGAKERGTVGVASVPSAMALLVSKAAVAFIDAFPRISLHLREDNSEAIQQGVAQGNVDFGLCSLWEPNSELSFEPLFEDRYGVVMSPQHRLAQQKGPLNWAQLSAERIFGFNDDLGVQRQLARTAGLSDDDGQPRYRVSNTSAISTLTESGIGVSVMSALAAHRAPFDMLSFRVLTSPEITRTVGVLARGGRSPSPAANAMLDLIRENLRSLKRFPGVNLL